MCVSYAKAGVVVVMVAQDLVISNSVLSERSYLVRAFASFSHLSVPDFGPYRRIHGSA